MPSKPKQTKIKHHGKENNAESMALYDANLDDFNKQCRKVYELLHQGRRLTVREALLKFNIGDLRRRVKDLIDMYGVPIKKDYAIDKYGTVTRFKVYYLEV